MPFLPVAAREARIAARSPKTYLARAGIAAVGLAAIPTILWSAPNAVGQGPAVFYAISMFAFLVCMLGGVLRTADAIAEERRENTLGLLFLTDLKAHDVLSGKFFASSASLIFGALALLPLLAIPVLLGGVSSAQLARVWLSLLNALFLSVSIGFLISTLVRPAWATISVSLLAILYFCLGIPALAWGETANLFSPLLLHQIAMSRSAGTPAGFWQGLVMNHLAAWLALLFALKYLPEAWRDRPKTGRQQIWFNELQNFRFGGKRTRKKFRTRLLNSNPLFWLANREQISSSGLMATLFAVALFSLLLGRGHFHVDGLLLMHAILLVRMASAASHSLAEDRKSGALELLLGTSLSVREVLVGRWMALGRQFFGPILIVVCWHAFAIAWVSIANSSYVSALMFYSPGLAMLFYGLPLALMGWIATGWAGMWLGLRARHPLGAMWVTLSVVVLIPLLSIFAFASLLSSLNVMPPFRQGFLGGQTQWIGRPPPYAAFGGGNHIASIFLLWGFYLFGLAVFCAKRLWGQFRQAATDRYLDARGYDWKPLRRVAWVSIGLVTILVGGTLGWKKFSLHRAEKSFQQALASNPSFSMEELLGTFVPAEQNLAQWEYFNNLNLNAGRVFRTGRFARNLSEVLSSGYAHDAALFAWQRGQALKIKASSPDPRAAAAAFLTRYRVYDSSIRELHQAAGERPFFQLPPKADAMVGHNMLSLIQFFSRRACARIALGENAIDDVMLNLRFVAGFREAGFNRSDFWVVNGIVDVFQVYPDALNMAIQPVHDGLKAGIWSEAELKRIQEYFSGVDLFEMYHRWREEMVRVMVQPQVSSPQEGNVAAIRKEQAEMLRLGLGILARAADGERRVFDSRNTVTGPEAPQTPVSQMQFRGDVALHAAAQLQTAADEVALACAIERFRLARKELPAKLEELVPDFIAKLPKDVATGGALQYRRETGGYAVYSLGFDGVDNSGKPGWVHQGGVGDWVWMWRAP